MPHLWKKILEKKLRDLKILNEAFRLKSEFEQFLPKFFNERDIFLSIDVEGALKGLKIAKIEDLDLLFRIGNLFITRKRFTSAESVYRKITKLMPGSDIAWFKLGNVLDDLERYDAAISCYDRSIELNRKFFEAHANKGIILGKLGKHEDAITNFDRALKINEFSPAVLQNKGLAFTRLEMYKEAIIYFDRAIEISNNKKSEALLEALLSKGYALSKIGKYDEAIECNNKTLNIFKDNWRLWINQGIAFGKLGRYKEEIRCYNKALRINQKLLVALSNKGITLMNIAKSLKTINKEKSKKYYKIAFNINKKAENLNPNNLIVLMSKGVILTELDLFDDALKCYDKIISINKNYPKAYGNKGILFLNNHKYDEAQRELKIAKKIFLENDRQNDAELAEKYVNLAINAVDLIYQLKPIDKLFLNCLKSQSLNKLKENIFYISECITDIIRDFTARELPNDAKELLISKEVCVSTLLNAIDFQEVDFQKLDNSKRVFEKWKLDDYIIAVNSLDSFIRYLNKIHTNYDIIPSVEIPK